ncbi:DNA polymerase III subunit chi [Aureimonas fodinaquatilis]|uniref:DNA polymerase III subunit chi n=1 Tax=Aureimonas fodinaquatilis TaxID=2565783 RepID=A0A5B0DYF3_9HYPH|nr:DNA polymerase III subunit chi [Aureimonas fodinaquatilis]KAA0970219.1 DNA polymerase III subunit chi [Aureimonas fodinaquatilis]
MAEVFFYHLTESRLEEALPDLLEKCLARGWRVVVQAATEERRDALDQHLWVYRDEAFLPHGSDAEGNSALQPILLTINPAQNANDAQVRFLVEGACPQTLEPYVRGIYLFDGHDADQLTVARERWKTEKAAGHSVVYWQQGTDRRWVRNA